MADLGLFADPALLQREQLLQEAKMSPQETINYMALKGGKQLGQGIGSLFGVNTQDPMMKRATLVRGLAQKYGVDTAEGLDSIAQGLQQAGDFEAAMQIKGKADALRQAAGKLQVEQATAAAKMREALSPEQKNAQALADASGAERGSAEWTKAYKDSLTSLTAKTESKSEFERILGSLGLSPEKEAAMKQQWVLAKLNPDPSGLKGLQAQIASLQAEQLRTKLEDQAQAKVTEKKQAIQKLSAVESGIDESLATAEQAIKLAPGTMAQAATQSILSNIPFTDAKSMSNLVGALKSDKATRTLEELKTQSRTGATGFGSLSAPELQLILDKTRSLDPTDKMFKENLGVIIDGWKRIRNTSMENRIDLQGNSAKLKELRSKVSAVKAKGSMTKEEKQSIDSLKQELGVN